MASLILLKEYKFLAVDATLNRGGIRMGTAEIYGVLDGLEFLQEHLIVDIPVGSPWGGLILFVTVKSPLDSQQLEQSKVNFGSTVPLDMFR